MIRCSGAQGRAALGALRTDERARTLLPLYLDLGHLATPVTVHFVVSDIHQHSCQNYKKKESNNSEPDFAKKISGGDDDDLQIPLVSDNAATDVILLTQKRYMTPMVVVYIQQFGMLLHWYSDKCDKIEISHRTKLKPVKNIKKSTLKH